MPKQQPEAYRKMQVTMIENRAIDRYLTYLATGKLPAKPGTEARLETLDARIQNAKRMIDKVKLIAERHEAVNPAVNVESLVEEFVKYAGSFSERYHVSYAAWREMGVPVEVLRQAGFNPPGGRTPKNGDATQATVAAAGKRTRRKFDRASAEEYMAYVDEHGVSATAEHYGYAEHYVTQLQQRLARKIERGEL